jgi:hypothetical protein
MKLGGLNRPVFVPEVGGLFCGDGGGALEEVGVEIAGGEIGVG